MDCPECGTNVKGVAVQYSILRLTLHNCPCCRKEWHSIELTDPAADRPMLVDLLEKQHRRYANTGSDHIKKVIWWLQSKIDSMAYEQTEEGQRKKKMDLWERQFINQATEEPY